MQSNVTLSPSTYLESILPCFTSCKNLIGAVEGFIARINADGSQIEIVYAEPAWHASDPGPAELDSWLNEEVLRYGRTLFRNDLPGVGDIRSRAALQKSSGNVLSAPVFIKGHIAGLFGYANKPGGFTEDDARIATAFGEIAAVALSESRIGDACACGLQFMALPSGPAPQILGLRLEDDHRNQAVRALWRDRRKLTTILNSMQDGVHIIDMDFSIQYANPAIIRQFGLVDGQKCYEYFHDRDAPCPWCQNYHVSNHQSLQFEFRSVKAGKSYEVFSTPFPNEDGTISKLDIMRDVTWRKEAERAVLESEGRYRILVETMSEGLIIMDDRKACAYANHRMCAMLGYTAEELIGRTAEAFVHEDDLKTFNEQMSETRTATAEPCEIALMHRDGALVPTLVSPRAVVDASGGYAGGFAVFTDITGRKKAEASLNDALGEIKRMKERLEAENVYFRKEIKNTNHYGRMIGQSNAFKYMLYRAEQVAPTDATVLIMGETGTGKGLLAATLHQMSPRRDRPMVTVNCAALPANLIESELFGRERGAYTGSDSRQIGRFEIANGSTICLDEISELPLDVQAKLLRVIQDHAFERLGSSRTLRVNARIVATTNRNLEGEVREGRFRQDLFYRLNVFPLTVPPLRKRKEDLPMLIQALATRFGQKMGKRFNAISRDALQELQDYDWPGNIRELENVIERSVILCPGPELRLPEKLNHVAVPAASVVKTMEEAERDHIIKTLAETGWQIGGPHGAAAVLDLPPSTLRSRMQKLRIRRPEPPAASPRNVAAGTTYRGPSPFNFTPAALAGSA
jgi:PAS domain S-box-containing protein